MLVTINTDAAFHSGKKVGGFAFWIVSNRGKIAYAGPLKSNVFNPDHAELQCIINAFHVLFTKTDWKNISRIIVNTDSLNSIHVLEANQEAIKKYRLKDTYFKIYRYRLKSLKKKYSVCGYKGQIEFRHVKAHTGTDNARKFVNDWCDKNAKEQLWKQINSKKS